VFGDWLCSRSGRRPIRCDCLLSFHLRLARGGSGSVCRGISIQCWPWARRGYCPEHAGLFTQWQHGRRLFVSDVLPVTVLDPWGSAGPHLMMSQEPMAWHKHDHLMLMDKSKKSKRKYLLAIFDLQSRQHWPLIQHTSIPITIDLNARSFTIATCFNSSSDSRFISLPLSLSFYSFFQNKLPNKLSYITIGQIGFTCSNLWIHWTHKFIGTIIC
jgi:hypothetical protein